MYSSHRMAMFNRNATLASHLLILPCDTHSWRVSAGHLWRVEFSHGLQVANMNCWSLRDPRKRFYTSKMRQIHSTHLTTGDRL